MQCNPILLDGPQDRGQILDRVESRTGDTRDEAWLQALIHARPELLPVSQFDQAAGMLIPLGREILTPSGPIDLLFATAQGRLVVVETKLWKNPQVHREVVAQIIDYAKELATWSYDDLETAVLSASRRMRGTPVLSIRERLAPVLSSVERDFHEYQEQLISNLAHGRFLLLIVGDRISPNVALLSAAIHGSPGLEFQFALVELRMHPLHASRDWPLLIVPEIVGRTIEETRAIVRIQYEETRPVVDVSVCSQADPRASKEKVSLESLRDQLPVDMRPVFERWSEAWLRMGNTFNFGTWGIGFHAPVKGVPRSIFETYPDSITLRTVGKHKSIEPEPARYEAYLEDLDSVPMARERLSAGHRSIQLKAITAEEYDAILRANVRFAERLASE